MRGEGNSVSLEIVHARRPKTFDKLDPKSLELEIPPGADLRTATPLRADRPPDPRPPPT